MSETTIVFRQHNGIQITPDMIEHVAIHQGLHPRPEPYMYVDYRLAGNLYYAFLRQNAIDAAITRLGSAGVWSDKKCQEEREKLHAFRAEQEQLTESKS